jgi:hypothetical protein
MQTAKEKYIQKKDSVGLLVSQTENNIKLFKANNKLIDSLSRYIVTALGKCWTDQEKAVCNTAKDIKCLNKDEKDIYIWLNIARKNPSLFAEMYVSPFIDSYTLSSLSDSTFRNSDTSGLWSTSYYANSLY